MDIRRIMTAPDVEEASAPIDGQQEKRKACHFPFGRQQELSQGSFLAQSVCSTRGGDDLVADGVVDDLGEGMQAKLQHNLRPVGLYGSHGDAQR